MLERSKKFYVTVGIMMISLAGLTGAAYQSDTFFLIKKNFTLFSEVVQEVNSRYVDETDPEELIRHAIVSMLELLDPYTVLIDEADNQNFEILTTGRYAGIGVEVGARGGRLVIIAPIEGYSAHQKGVRAGDTILSVDGISVIGMTLEDLDSLIRGEPGTLIVLTVERSGFDQPIEFELIRENVEVKNVAYYGFADADSSIGFVSLSRFGQGASMEVRDAIQDLKSRHTLKGFILDLRNNPGGLLDEAVNVVDKFVGPGIQVVQTQGRSFDASFASSTDEPILFDGPVAVLQNNGSASSSEIVSGALQDLDRAVIIGTRSFGKGLVQIVRPLSYNNSLKITTSRYFIPSGRSIQSAVYSHSSAGHATQIPDSLRKEFKTLKGRSVFDGIGIDPDVVIDEEPQSLIEIALLQNSAYFFFANEYRSQHATLAIDSVDQRILDDFYAYLDRTGFNYTTRAERYLTSLETQLLEDGFTTEQQHIAAIRSVVGAQKRNDLHQIAPTIRYELYEELVARYRGESGRFKVSMKHDKAVLKAIELLSDPTLLRQVLGD
jgi:carboxyl-terminal processing protease